MCHLWFMTGMTRPWRIAGAIYVLAVLIFATYVYALDFDLIRFLWLGTAPLGLAVPYVAYLASVPLILLGLVDPVDGNGLVPLLIPLWTLAAAGNVMIARSIWNALRSRCPRQVSTLVSPRRPSPRAPSPHDGGGPGTGLSTAPAPRSTT